LLYFIVFLLLSEGMSASNPSGYEQGDVIQVGTNSVNMKVTSVVPKESTNGKGDFLLTIRALNARQHAVGPGGFAYVLDKNNPIKLIKSFKDSQADQALVSAPSMTQTVADPAIEAASVPATVPTMTAMESAESTELGTSEAVAGATDSGPTVAIEATLAAEPASVSAKIATAATAPSSEATVATHVDEPASSSTQTTTAATTCTASLSEGQRVIFIRSPIDQCS